MPSFRLPLVWISIIALCAPCFAQSAVQSFIRGDTSGDGVVGIEDPIGTLSYLFVPGATVPACLDAADADDNGAISIGDAIYVLSFLFVDGSPTPPAPYPACGLDVGIDTLGCGSAAAGAACPLIADLTFDWPVPGQDTHDWVINNYVDLDPTTGATLDYMGGNKTYDGHRGIDIDVPNFRYMDTDWPIVAAAPGVVVDTEDSNEDRHMSCFGDWNYVKIQHANGWTSTYGHLKQGSVVVTTGQSVSTGQVLGVVGSSGCSTAPHLHFEVRDENNAVIEPFQEGMWNQAPTYNTPLGFMDVALYRQPVTNVAMVLDPPANISVIEPGETLGVGLSMAGGQAGSTIELRLRQPNGVTYASTTFAFSSVARHSFWWWNPTIGSGAPLGNWDLEIRTNGVLAAVYDLNVGSVLTGYRQVRHGVPGSSYQQVFDNLVANGYRPIWIDGYDYLGEPYFNLIFDKSPASGWFTYHGLTGTTHQTVFDDLTSQGYRLVHIDSYLDGGAIRYATIYEGGLGYAFAAYHGASTSDHQSQFSALASAGYRAKNISVVEVGGSTYYTALYDTKPVGGWVALSGLTAAQYQTEFDTQTAAGRELAYLDAYRQSGTPKYSAIWIAAGPSSWVARHALLSDEFQSEFDTWEGAGLATRFITAHQVTVTGGLFSYQGVHFSGFWSN
ncbi:MAG: peptidoglycan DD-metalloendopeptidase family protein [Planctomycetes bacterium]|nr:peptidoglycan DD-metalloendopeptidase family protein [Planctomycetota bacterium]